MKAQEDAGIDIVSDGEQSRQHFVHGFLGGSRASISAQVRMGIRDNRYEAMVPTGRRAAAPARSRACRGGAVARAHTKRSSNSPCPGP